MDVKESSVLLHCRVTPNAKISEVLGWMTDERGIRRLKVKLAALPVDGKANQELVKFLSKELAVTRSRLKLVSGEKSRLKTVQVSGIGSEELGALLKTN